MHHFHYINGILHAENVSIMTIAEKVGTPFYCYSEATLRRHAQVMTQAFEGINTKICYAMKANSNQAVLKILADEGLGADVVSGGELKRALLAGVDPSKIMFSGVGKTCEEMKYALESGIHCFNIESRPELDALNDVAARLGVKAPISLRINPDIDAGTHDKISTGKSENKFGIPFVHARETYAYAASLAHLRVIGIDMHIGSQITQLKPFDDAFAKLSGLINDLRGDGHNIRHVDLGGGLGIPYNEEEDIPPLPKEYAEVVKKHVAALGCDLVLEPGRLIAGNAGILVTKTIFYKQGDGKNFIIVDAGMNDLIRPTLYEAYHAIKPVVESDTKRSSAMADVVGPVCETGDYLAKGRILPMVERDSLLAVYSAGAYGAVTANSYNTRAMIPEVLVKDDKFHVIRKRETVEELIAKDDVPNWLE